jgi:hypothetical protein
MDYFATRMRITPELCESILADLVNWKKIDRQLWELHRGVWYEKFVSNHSHVYEKRKRNLPVKPLIPATEIQDEPDSCHRNTTTPSIPDTESTHSIVEYSIAQNSIVQDSTEASLSGSDEPKEEHPFLILFNEITGRKIRGFSDKAKRQLTKLKNKKFKLADFQKAISNGHKSSARWENPALFTPEYITREDKFLLFLNWDDKQTSPNQSNTAKRINTMQNVMGQYEFDENGKLKVA